MSQTQILLYNFKDEDRLRQIRRYLNRHRISVRMVQQPEYLKVSDFSSRFLGFLRIRYLILEKIFRKK